MKANVFKKDYLATLFLSVFVLYWWIMWFA